MTEQDAFWDRPAGNVGGPELDPTAYHDPSEQSLLSGQPMSSRLPSSGWGLRGTIIRKSDEHGAPIGHNPSGVVTELNVDPDIPGQGFKINPSQISKMAMNQAIVEEGADKATSLEDRRFKASNVLRRFATGGIDPAVQTPFEEVREAPLPVPGTYVTPRADDGGGQIPMSQPSQVPPPQSVGIAMPVDMQQQLDAQQPQIQQGPAVSTQPVATPTVKAASTVPFAQPAAVAPPPPSLPSDPNFSLFQQQQHMHLPSEEKAAEQGKVGPPEIKVTMETESSPIKGESYFHQVVRQDATLVLVFDVRSVGYPTGFPKSTDEDLAIYIEGSESIYITQTTGIMFKLDTYSVCVLMIKDEKPLASS